MHTAKSYLNFLLKSKNQHGVHSPFVYDLVTKCFYDSKSYSEYEILKNYRNSLLKDKLILEITDFGSGSKTFKSSYRSVSDITKTSGTTFKHAKLLFRLAMYFQPKNVLELGTSVGIGTSALALGNKNSNITSIEGCPKIADFTIQQLKKQTIDNVTIINDDFKPALLNMATSHWDFVFFDGHHDELATIKYFEQLLPKAHNNSMFIFDDIYWSKGMTKAWNHIKTHPKVTVSIDTFQYGIVFFRKEQTKEDFVIRL